MSVSVNFYKISDDPRVLKKTLGDPLTNTPVAATVKDNCDILNPTLCLRYNATIAGANYMHIGAPFNRYYFIEPPVVGPGKRMWITGTVDPLFSWGEDIGKLNVLVTRNEALRTKEIADARAIATADTTTCSAKFSGTSFNTDEVDANMDSIYHYVLTVVGGLNNQTP